ncbi:MAG TPA: tryptophan 2,3-dioxygenase family protein [Nitrososphaerales archaeon]|nr:tryptophan 2,3-dioxygenase family protein [Nitrososphaerales archaeon]
MAKSVAVSASTAAERKKPLSYSKYLELDTLLRIQRPQSRPAQHDETLFIIAHQTYELWFKLMLHELRSAVQLMRSGDCQEAARLVRRVVAVQKILIQQLEVLETIRSVDFLRFRDVLSPASGFQSLQFRELEFISGMKDERFLKLHADDRRAYAALKNQWRSPSLWDGFRSALRNEGLDPGKHRPKSGVSEKEIGAIVKVYKDGKHPALLELAEALLEYDKYFWLWRNHHMGMVERIIGRRVGTGVETVVETVGPYSFDSSGVSYLRTTLRKRFFPALWAARGRLED